MTSTNIVLIEVDEGQTGLRQAVSSFVRPSGRAAASIYVERASVRAGTHIKFFMCVPYAGSVLR